MKFIGEMEITQNELIAIAKDEVLKSETMQFVPTKIVEQRFYKVETTQDCNRIYCTLYYGCLPNLNIYRFFYNKFEKKLFYEKIELAAGELTVIKDYGKNQYMKNGLQVVK